ncbi:MAG: lipopolysaccharide assembly protein LapA domain-containing protein [Flavobacterium sp.]
MKKLTTNQIINILLIVALLLFIGQNLDMVRVKFLFFGFELPLFILIAIVFLIGYYTAIVFRKRRNEY